MRRPFESGILLHLLTAAFGTTRTSRDARAMSVIEGKAEVKYSLRVFRMLTHQRHRACKFAVVHKGASPRAIW